MPSSSPIASFLELCPLEFTSPSLPAPAIASLGGKLKQALAHWGTGRLLPPDSYNKMQEAMRSCFRLVPSLVHALDKNEEILVQFTEEQAKTLDGLSRNRRVLVEGAAGTGNLYVRPRQPGTSENPKLPWPVP